MSFPISNNANTQETTSLFDNNGEDNNLSTQNPQTASTTDTPATVLLETEPSQSQETSINNEVPDTRNAGEQLFTDYTKQYLQKQLLSSSSNNRNIQPEQDKDKNKVDQNSSPAINAPVTAGIVAGNAFTRQTQSAQEIYGYPARSTQSDQAASIFENMIKKEYKKNTAAIGAQIREDGTVVLALAGANKSVIQDIYNKHTPALQTKPNKKDTPTLQTELNRAFGSDPKIAKDNNGNVKFEFGSANATTEHLNKTIPFTNKDFDPDVYNKAWRVCAEDRLYQTSNASKAESMTVIWRTNFSEPNAKVDPNDHAERLNNIDTKAMVPCVSCKENADVVITANSASEEARNLLLKKGGQQLTSGGIGATISAGFYVFNQLKEGKPIDGKDLIKQSAIGGGSGIASNFIEQQISKKLLLAPQATQTMAQFIPRQAYGAGVAGVVIGGGLAAFQNYDDFQRKKIDSGEYAGKIGKEALIGGAAAVSGTVAGAAIGGTIGSAVPVAGTAVGIVAGAVIGYAVDQTIRLMVDGKPTEKVVIPPSAFDKGLQLKVPVYANDRQFNVVTRSFEMMAKSTGLPQSEVEKFVSDWQARYQLSDKDKMVYYSPEGTREISDEEFDQIKQQGFMMSSINGTTHAEVINDLKTRLAKIESNQK